MQVINRGPSAAPASQPRPQVTVDTGAKKSPMMQKIDALKGRLSGHFTPETPKNKQGEVIPPQPSGGNPEASKGQQPTIETPKASPEAPSSPQSPQLTALARQQQSLRKAQQDLKVAQEAWKQEQAKYVSRETLSSDPLKALAEAGISQDRLVELQLNQAPPPSETQLLHDKIAELEKKLNGVDETFKSRDKQAYDQAVLTIKKDTELLVKSDQKYEILNALGPEGVDEVVKFIEKQFAKDGTVLDVETAAHEINELAKDRELARVRKFQALASIKQLLTPPVTESSVTETEETKQSPLSQATTITNKMGVNRPLTARERAILAFQRAQQSNK